MAKEGMKRPESNEKKPKNSQRPVPEIQGKSKTSNEEITTIVD